MRIIRRTAYGSRPNRSTTRSPVSRSTTASSAPSAPPSLFLLRIPHACALRRHFETDNALRSHWKTKIHKKRCKLLREPAYTIEEAERAAGLGRDDRRATHAEAPPPDAPMAAEPTPS
jgi:hypothetical protein